MDTRLIVSFAAFLLQFMSAGVAVHFSQDALSIWLPADLPVGGEVARVALLKEYNEMKHSTTFTLEAVHKDENIIRAMLSTFRVDELTGVVRTRRKLSHLDPDTRHQMRLRVELKGTNSTIHSSMNIDIKISKFDSSKCRQESELVCFGKTGNIAFNISENVPSNQSFGFISQPAFRIFCRTEVNATYRLENSEFEGYYIDLHPSSGELFVLSTLDREKVAELNFNITCDITTKDSVRKSAWRRRKLTIYVTDENDVGPYLLNNISEISFTDTGNLQVGEDVKTRLYVIDNDTTVPRYAVSIIQDPLQLFSLKKTTTFQSAIKQWVIEAELHLVKKLLFPGNTYNVSVNFTDEGLPTWNSKRTIVSSMILHTVQNVLHNSAEDGKQEEQSGCEFSLHLESYQTFNVTIFSSAAMFSRVAHPFKENKNVTKCSGLEFWLTNANSQSGFLPFNVTPRLGIIYVNSSIIEHSNPDQDITFIFELHWKNGNESINDEDFVTVQVYVKYADNLKNTSNSTTCEQEDYYEAMCAMYNTVRSCEQNCGGGSSNGTCHWIPFTKEEYSTCSPDPNTCPDGICDELEALFSSLCLQDCVPSYKVKGFKLSKNHDYHELGIKDVRGICTCDTSVGCTCFPYVGKPLPRNRTTDASENPANENTTIAVSTQTETTNIFSNEPTCGQECIVVLILSLVLIVLMTFFAVTICRSRFRLRGWTKGRKYPGSSISLPAVPSDYVDEHSPSVVSNSDTLSTSMSKLLVIDYKWEFPRDRLILEQTLGEGEFGRVVKAKALDISGMSGYITVAVKMLKNGGTNSEQDLISEFNLLKEVSHPNVIRLLGACTSKGGPLYIIVEYAEYGSLRGYLRRSRRLEFRSCTSDDSGVDSIATSTHKETSESQLLSDYHLSKRDLVSFAWQISKGMAYLSEMKLVHRDLAARNVLVASGKIVKISDFGLTRDIYVEDAYFKKSLGRVPVKWMAIESLVDNIYTTKSDVWSFGIVLWEIVTLGAGPYPGVSPERLYQLLKNGYRMENPDSNSEELYKIMLKCWTDNPQERPSFSELTIVFDRMLQENVDYLDLTMNVVHNLTYLQDIPRRNEFDGEEVEESEEGEAGYGSWNAFTSDDTDVGSQACHVLSNANTLAVPATANSGVPSRDSSASDYEDAFFLQPTTSDLNLSVVVQNTAGLKNCDVDNRVCDEHVV